MDRAGRNPDLFNGGQRWRPPLKEDAPAPPDPDRPYLILYATLAGFMVSIANIRDLKAWIAQNKPAFDALKQGSPERADRLREIYFLHVASLSPHAVQAAPPPPPIAMPAADLVDGILSGADGDDA